MNKTSYGSSFTTSLALRVDDGLYHLIDRALRN